MSNGNPFDKEIQERVEAVSGPLPDIAQIQEAGVPDPDNPFDEGLFEPGQKGFDAPVAFTAGGAFSQGVKEGVLAPFDLIGLDVEDVDTGRPIAETLGELTGFGVGFVPFLGAARLGIKGAGLAKGMSPEAVNAFLASRRGQAAVGALSFGTFEAGTADELREVPGKFALGAGLGAVLDPLAHEALGRILGRSAAKARKEFQRDIGKTIKLADGETVIDPAQLRVERVIHPNVKIDGDKPGFILRALAGPEVGLDDQLITAALAYQPGGVGIIQSTKSPGRTIAKIKRTFGNRVGILSRKTDDGITEIALVDTETPLTRLVAKMASLEEKSVTVEKIVSRFLGKGKPALTFDEALELVNEVVPRVIVESEKEMAERLGKSFNKDTFFGQFTWDPIRSHRMLIANDVPVTEYETLVHEFTHWLTHMKKLRVTGAGGGETPITMMFREQFEEMSQAQMLKVFDEMRDATEEIVIALLKRREKIHGAAARASAKKIIKNDRNYFHADDELMSRLAELMFLDPAKAKKVAPNATRLMGDLIQNEFPRMEKILSKQERVLGEVIVREFGEPTKIFARTTPRFTDDMARQFEKHGHFEGMTLIGPDGSTNWEFVKKLSKSELVKRQKGKPSEDLFRIRNTITGDSRLVTSREFMRPLMPRIQERSAGVLQAIRQTLDEGPLETVGLALRDPNTGNVVQGMFNLRNVVRTQDARRWALENRAKVVGTQARGGAETLSRSGSVSDEEIALIAQRLGFDGVVENEAGTGIYRLYVGNSDNLILGDVAATESATGAIDGAIGDRVFQLDFENVMRSLLRERGASEREIPHLLEAAKQEHGRRLRGLLDPETEKMLTRAEKELLEHSDPLEEFARRGGIEAVRDNGRWTLLDSDNKSLLARDLTDSEALEYIARSGVSSDQKVINVAETDDVVAAATGGTNASQTGYGVADDAMGGGAAPNKPVKPQEQLMSATADDYAEAEGFTFKKLMDAFSLAGSRLTNMEDFAKIAQEQGFGPAWSRIYRPLQDAILEIDKEIGGIGRKLLSGETYEDFMRGVTRRVRKLDKPQREQIVDWMEFMTKDEIAAAGGLLQRGMTEAELNVARQVEKLGIAHDLPRLHAIDRLVDLAEQNVTKFRRQAEQALQSELDEGTEIAIRRLVNVADNSANTREGMIAELGLSAEERMGLDIVSRAKEFSPDEFSIFAVGRYASAPAKPKGFKGSGRELFARQNNMTDEQIAIGRKLDKVYRQAFEDAGLDPRRMIGGYWPHMRKYTQVGFTPDEDFIRMAMPDAHEWSHARIRTGELNMYSRDPIDTTMRYLRSLFSKKHIDPKMDDVKDALEQVRTLNGQEGRIHRAMQEYVNEITGGSHTTFKKLDQLLRGSMKMLGIDLDPGFSHDLINTMTALAYSATIPFRPGLIARNYYQLVQTIPARVGGRHFKEGIKRARGDGGWEAAVQAGAIPTQVAPVEASNKVFERGMFGNIDIGQKADDLFRKGFEWYRDADEFGRAVAFHAQRARVEAAEQRLRAGDINFEQFLKEAKVRTFKQVDQKRFEELWRADQFEEAKNFLGRTLSNETMFRYGHANHPHGWNSVYGRLFGQFGTWPVQYKDFLAQGITRGTAKDKAEFLAWQIGTNVGTVTAGSAAGINLMSWATFPSLTYTGGPYADMFLNMATIVGGSDTERSLAMRSLTYTLPTLSNPQSIFIPGSYFLGDIGDALGAGDAREAFFETAGIRMLKSSQERPALDLVRYLP